MGSNESIFRPLGPVTNIGMLHIVPRSVISAALGKGMGVVSTARSLFGEIVFDGTALMMHVKAENALLTPLIPTAQEPLLIIIFKKSADKVVDKTLTPNTVESGNLVMAVLNHLLNKTIHFDVDCPVLVYGHNDALEMNTEKIAWYIIYHSLILFYIGKLNYAPYASNENLFITFPNGLGLGKDIWINGTYTKNGAGVPKKVINSVLKLEHYNCHLDYPTFKTSGGFYSYNGKVDLLKKTIELEKFEPNGSLVANIKVELDRFVVPNIYVQS